MCSLMNKDISGPFIFDVSGFLPFFWVIINTQLCRVAEATSPPRDCFTGCDGEAAGGAIRGAARGLEVGHQLPCPRSQPLPAAPPPRHSRGGSQVSLIKPKQTSIANGLEISLQLLVQLRKGEHFGGYAAASERATEPFSENGLRTVILNICGNEKEKRRERTECWKDYYVGVLTGQSKDAVRGFSSSNISQNGF